MVLKVGVPVICTSEAPLKKLGRMGTLAFVLLWDVGDEAGKVRSLRCSCTRGVWIAAVEQVIVERNEKE
jgi:hypothetical protein